MLLVPNIAMVRGSRELPPCCSIEPVGASMWILIRLKLDCFPSRREQPVLGNTQKCASEAVAFSTGMHEDREHAAGRCVGHAERDDHVPVFGHPDASIRCIDHRSNRLRSDTAFGEVDEIEVV